MVNEIRDQLLRKRDQLSEVECRQLNSFLMKNLKSIELISSADRIGCFVSKDKEVDTHSFIKEVIEKGKEMYVPHTLWENKMEFSKLTKFENMERGKYGILETKELTLPKQDIEIAIIPGAAFDKGGNRIGYGKGFFDRAFANLKYLKNCTKIGVAYDFQVFDQIERKKWDLKVDYIVTDIRVIKCSNHQ